MIDYLCLTHAEYSRWVYTYSVREDFGTVYHSWLCLPYPFFFEYGEPLVILPITT